MLPPEDGTAYAMALAGSQGPDFDSYPDAEQVPEYARGYLRILVAWGAVSGRDGMLLPASPMTRAEICKALVVMQDS